MRFKDKPPGSYSVGYGRPPRNSQFKLGQSGNPNGRPRGARNRSFAESENNRLRAILSAEANRLIDIQNANGGIVKVTTTLAVIRSIADNALKGDQRSQRLYTDLVGEQERKEKEERDETFVGWLKYKNAWGPEFARRKSRGMAEPDQLPHPDHVVLDPATCTVSLAGPVTKEEKASWERWSKIRAAISKELANCGPGETFQILLSSGDLLARNRCRRRHACVHRSCTRWFSFSNENLGRNKLLRNRKSDGEPAYFDTRSCRHV